ncbi:MAG: nucleotidyltransferase domain-containing protein [Rhizobiaceae bacterium]
MALDTSKLAHLPLHKKLVQSAYDAFANEAKVRAIVLVGSLVAGRGDRVSDADIVVFTCNDYHRHSGDGYKRFEAGKEIIYTLESDGRGPTTFRKYLFGDLTSAEIHCMDLSAPLRLSKPFEILIDKDRLVPERTTDAPPIKHEDFPVYDNGDAGLIWELVDCIKWLSRGNTELAKDYLRRLGDKL